MVTATLVVLPWLLAAAPGTAPQRPFAIEIVDDRTGRGVPLIELRTVNGIRLVTDSHGIAAFDEPGLRDTTVFFHVQGHGYEFSRDGFGFRGKALRIVAGGSARLPIRRVNIAERLYRMTGAGIYRDSVLVGRKPPIRHPLLNAQVFGSDSVVNAVYRGKISWFWGDTNRPGYPLGNYQVPGATSLLPTDGGLDPEQGVDLDYFVGDSGFARPTAEMPGRGPTWIDGLVVLRDPSGRERMLAAYAKVRNLLDIYERGLVEFDDAEARFKKVVTFGEAPAVYPGGHPFQRTVDGVEYVYFATPYPLLRVRADAENLAHPDRYEAFTCLAPGTRLDAPRIERDGEGQPRYGWKKDTPAVGPAEQPRLIKAGLLKPSQALLQLRDIETGKAVSAHSGSVYWHDDRKRWVMITVESAGTSYLGEVWFAEADTPIGPWVYARKVVTHERYSFYNPKEHPMLAREGGRVLFFEGTYTQSFSGNPDATPRYEYNQIMYKLDLADPRLILPVPVYRVGAAEGAGFATAAQLGPKRPSGGIAFFANERPGPATVAVFATITKEGRRVLVLGADPANETSRPLFYAVSPDAKDPPATTLPLYEYKDADGKGPTYSTETSPPGPGPRRPGRSICRVWPNPMSPALTWE